MSEKYILDGYNVIMKLPKLREMKASKGLAGSREALARLLLDIKHCHARAEFTIVFDGKAGELPGHSRTSLCGISCHFTKKGEEADDHIGEMLKNMKDRTGVVVISDDGKVSNKCMVYGVEIRHPSTLEGSFNKRFSATNSDGKDISRQAASDITKWYEEQLDKRKGGKEDK